MANREAGRREPGQTVAAETEWLGNEMAEVGEHRESPPRVLLIEDEAVDVVAVRRAMGALGMAEGMAIVGNANDALDKLDDSDDFGLILLDLDLPGTSGLELLSELRTRAGRQAPPIVVLTSSRNAADCNAAYRAGAAGYFVKPLSWDDLLAKLQLVVQYWSQSLRPTRS